MILLNPYISFGYSFSYTDIPSRPTLGTNQTLTYSAPGNILNSTGGTSQDKIMSGSWDQFHAYSFVGTSEAHQRISNEDSDVIIGGIANHLFTREGTGTTYFELNGKSSSEPLYFKNVGAVDATSAVQVSAFATGVYDPEVNITVSNCRIAGATSLFGDSRGGGATGTLTDGGGNTFVSASEIPTPTFSNYTPTDFTGHGLLTESYNHALGRGYRTPDAA